MNIPLVENLGADGKIIAGEHKGRDHYYKTALYNTLLALKPRVCLEIGVWFGGTVQIFERYFEEHQPDGRLVAADIKFHCAVRAEHTRRVLVYRHAATIGNHPVTEAESLPDSEKLWFQSVPLNIYTLGVELEAIGETDFDFCFIDGDHRKVSVEKDLAICKALSQPPCYILYENSLDDVHESARYYVDVVSKQWQHYDFEDWPMLSGAALIWEDES